MHQRRLVAGDVRQPVDEPAFYAYAYPEPAGCAQAPIRPSGARYDTAMREWILPHADVIKTENPDAVALEFLQATYDIASHSDRGTKASSDRSRSRSRSHGTASGDLRQTHGR